MLKYDSGLQTALAAATNKLDWCITLLNTLGSGLTIRCKRSPDSASTTVFDTGVEFYSASISGTPVRSGGSIVKFGTIANATIEIGADLSSGASVLRIEGNGHWIEGTLGLTNSSCDFKVSQSPTTKTGLAFSTVSVSAPRSLPSGTGPVAPTLNANAPAYIRLEDWTDPANPKTVDTIPLDVHADDLVFQDSEVASEIGDVRITQSSRTIIYGQFEFGATMFSINGGLNLDSPGTPVHQIVVAHKPFGTWPTYPFSDSFRASRDTTFAKPFKIKVLDSNSNVLKVFEMRDGLPLNDPRLAQNWGKTQTLPLRPHLHCGQWLFWQSAKLKYSSNGNKYVPGISTYFTRPSICKLGPSTNAAIPLAVLASNDTGGQRDSALQWHAMPEWPMAFCDSTGLDPVGDAGDTFDDPHLYDMLTWHRDEGCAARISGWNVEPGSISGHDWLIGPGGVRHDRGVVSTPLVKYFHNPSGSRTKGNVPYRTLLDCYNHGYFHHGHHLTMSDVKNFTPLPKEFVRDGKISWGHAYYNGAAFGFVPGGLARHVDLMGVPNGYVPRPAPVRDGHKFFYNGWGVDNEHSYIAPGVATIFCNSPAHAVSNTLRFAGHIMSQLNSAPPNGGMISNWLYRIHAWRVWQLIVAWKVASTNSMCLDRETVEQRFQAELEAVYDQIYVPTIINNDPDPMWASIRNFGQISQVEIGTGANAGKKWLRAHSDYKIGYWATVFLLMRQTGCWAAMRARSTKCDVALRFMMDCVDKDILGSLYYTNGRYDANFRTSDMISTSISADPTLYSGWSEWVTKIPAVGQESLMTDVTGAVQASMLGGGTTMRLQYAYMRRDYFPEIPAANIDAICAMIDGWMVALEAKVNARPTQISMTNNDMTYAWPPQAIWLPPTTLGPF